MDEAVRLKLPEPKFKLLSRDIYKNYCEVCYKCWDKKSSKKRSKLINVDIKKFESLAARWELVNHVYNEVYKRRPCYSMFFKVDYLNSQKPIDI